MTLSLSLKSPSSTGRGRAGACSRKSLRDPGSCQLVVLLGLQSLPLGSSADGGPLGGPSGPGLGEVLQKCFWAEGGGRGLDLLPGAGGSWGLGASCCPQGRECSPAVGCQHVPGLGG